MRIGIDARFFGSIGKGLGRYTQKLIENLEKIDNTNQYFVFLKEENFDEYQPKNPNFQKVLANFRWYTFSEQVKFPKLLRKYNLDLVHFPHFNVPILTPAKFVVTIHEAEARRQNFGQVGNAYIRALNVDGEQEIARYDLSEEASTETAMIFGELYRHSGEWRFTAVGQGYAGGLAAMCRQYGLNL